MAIPVSKIFGLTVIVGMMCALPIVSSANAQERIRLNPEYKAPTEQELSDFSEGLFTEDITDDFNSLLNPQEESDQYILLTEPKERETSFVSLDQSDQKEIPLFQLDHQYQTNSSSLFNMSPDLIANGMNQGGLSAGAASSQLVLSLNPSRQEASPFFRPRKLELRLGSSFVDRSVSSYSPILFSGFGSQRAYNVSLGVNYSGFNVGASISRNNMLYMPQLRGFDLGFGYNADSWSANFRVGEYRRDNQLAFGRRLSLFENVSSYELGAAYRLFSNVNLTGRFTYYSYGLGGDIAPLDDVKSLIFGTNLSF